MGENTKLLLQILRNQAALMTELTGFKLPWHTECVLPLLAKETLDLVNSFDKEAD